MRRWTRNIWHYLTSGKRTPQRAAHRRRRLEVEYLEDRTVLSTANFTGTITGTAFLDTNSNGTLDKGELAMPGVKVVLNGTLTTPIANTITAASWANGVVTMTTSVENVLTVGSVITISGMTPTAYNGTFTVTKVSSATTFTFTLATNPGKATAFGTATETGATATSSTNKSGTYTFNNVLPGTYTVTGGPATGLITTGSTTKTISNVSLTAGGSLNENIPFTGKLSASAISMALFLTETVSVGTSFGPISTAPALVNPQGDSAPTVSTAIAAQSVSLNAGATHLDLAGNFTDPNMTNSQVTFNITNGTSAEKIVLDLFDTKDPQTVANFFDYINSGSYDNSIFHRLVTSGINILQGGALALAPNGTTQQVTLTNATAGTTKFTLTFNGQTTSAITLDADATTNQNNIQTALQGLSTFGGAGGTATVTQTGTGSAIGFTITFGGTLANSAQPLITGHVTTAPGTITTSDVTTLNNIPILSPGSQGVPSEFPSGTSPPAQNVAGTIAMALSGSPSDPNSGTDQFFFNVGNNSSSLDSQKFTTFGKIESISTTTLNTLGKTPTKNVSNSTLTAKFPTADFQNIPLVNYNGTNTSISAASWANGAVTVTTTAANHLKVGSVVTIGGMTPSGYNGTFVVTSVPTATTFTYALATNPGTATTPLGTVGTFPGDATPSNFMRINSVTVDKRSEFLTYSVVSNTNPGLVTPSVTNEWLTLHYTAGVSGTATITVKATDRYGASVTQTFTVTVNGPTVTGVTLATNDPTDQNVTAITATPKSTDPNNTTVNYTYQWLQNGQPITSVPTSQTTQQTLQLAGITVNPGDTFSVKVTPTDTASPAVTGAPFTSKAVTIATVTPHITIQTPTVSSVAVAADNASSATTLTATPTSPADPLGQTITYTYQWLHNGQPITGVASATTATLQLAGITVAQGDTFSVQVTPSDGTLTGPTFTSDAVAVAGTNPTQIAQAPTITSVLLQPSNPTTSSTLTANVTATDPQNRTLTYTYVWTDETSGVTLRTTTASPSSSDSLDLTGTSVLSGDTVSVAVTVNNGLLNSNPSSTSVQVA